MGGLRERNKAKRREAIVDSALALLRQHELHEVSIERVAAGAEVSPATVYNLVGGREASALQREPFGRGSSVAQRHRIGSDKLVEIGGVGIGGSVEGGHGV